MYCTVYVQSYIGKLIQMAPFDFYYVRELIAFILFNLFEFTHHFIRADFCWLLDEEGT